MKQVINIREIIKELDSRNLKIEDRHLLAYHIQNFNYNTFIYGYSEPFLIEGTNKYDEEASSDQMIALYKFDRDMANHILRFILVIEKILNTNVVYEIINTNNLKDKCLFKLSEREIQNNILPNLNEIMPRSSYYMFVMKLLKYVNTNKSAKRFLNKNANDEIYRWANCPLDLMCLTWSFATTFSLFIALNNETRTKILTNFRLEAEHLNAFIDFMKNALHLRNMISHNNVIFNADIPYQSAAMNNIYEFVFKKKVERINLIHLIELIDYFSNSKTLFSNTKYHFNKLNILKKFKDKILIFNE